MIALELKSSSSLLEVLRRAATTPPSKEEVQQQRVSFVYSFMGDRSNMTREQVAQAVEDQQGGAK